MKKLFGILAFMFGIAFLPACTFAADTTTPVVSVLGDSISTWDAVSEYPVYMGYYGEKYPGLSNQNETYWQMYINCIHGKLGRLGSVGGSKVVNDGTMGDLYMASDKRINDLGSNGTPDIILFFGGMNDIICRVPTGSLGTISYGDTSNFASAYYTAVCKMRKTYPNAKIICMAPYITGLNSPELTSVYDNLICEIATMCGVECVDLRTAGLIYTNDTIYRPQAGDYYIHPNFSGMHKIALRLLDGDIRAQFYFDGSCTYFIQSDGSCYQNRLSYDPEGTGIIYFDSWGHMAFNSSWPIGNYWYFFGNDGRLYYQTSRQT